ncbi:hypothetical protein G8E05_06290 [Clostridium botulinum]|nr:hypothetical protein [Clostridium botulinum]AJD28516.1 hypothetical protein T257_3105 [Clostridium botulinum CDC_297]EPS50170.1 hypothetical protein CFSAN002368_14973 [Clostridium botulinum A1 str. CFSAN002368]APU61236.1 hypothetical protein NPD8_3195 [Clostridium botulinum]MBY6877716.1 hypothetical protein [Clostridium botulinum]MBY6892007.1 hypothetical protein [Clostridium botulinum]
MDKRDKDALIYRLNLLLKYAEEENIEKLKNEAKSIADEIDKYDLVVPF